MPTPTPLPDSHIKAYPLNPGPHHTPTTCQSNRLDIRLCSKTSECPETVTKTHHQKSPDLPHLDNTNPKKNEKNENLGMYSAIISRLFGPRTKATVIDADAAFKN
jgi:hypothetical protein